MNVNKPTPKVDKPVAIYGTPWGPMRTTENDSSCLNGFASGPGYKAYWHYAPGEWDGKFDRANPPDWIKSNLIPAEKNGGYRVLPGKGVDFLWLASKEMGHPEPKLGTDLLDKLFKREDELRRANETTSS